jgi:hypothetical protein
MGQSSGELRGGGAKAAVHFGSDPGRSEASTGGMAWRLLKSNNRESVAALTRSSGGTVRRSASCAKSCTGKRGEQTSALHARFFPPRSFALSRATRWRIFIARVTRSSLLCVLIIQFLPGAIHRNHAGEMLQILSPASPCNPRSLRDRQEINLASTMPGTQEPELVCPGVSVDEPAHVDIHCDAQRQEREQHRRPAVTH